jgi:ABC-2 type transport system permease protein
MSPLTGTGALARLGVRRDRFILPAALCVPVAFAAQTAGSTRGRYPTAASMHELAVFSNRDGGTLAVHGRVFADSLGGLTAWQAGVFGGLFAGLLSILIVVRHTRVEAEAGRLELVRAGAVGRPAVLAAALLIASGASLALGLAAAAVLVAVGLPATGSVAFGLSWAAAGWAYAAIAAATVTLCKSPRVARATAIAVLGLSYLLRALGDVARGGGMQWLTWLSPLGWAEQVRAFAVERWWVLGLAAAFTVAVAGAAYALAAGQEAGVGLAGKAAGPAHASPALRGAIGLAWRLHRGPLVAWTAGFAVGGFVLGSLATTFGYLFGGGKGVAGQSKGVVEALLRVGGQTGVTDSYLAMIVGVFGLIAAAYAIVAARRLRAEETALRAEPLLASTVGRSRWMASHLVLVVAGTALTLAAAGLGTGLSYGMQAHALSTQLPRELGAALAQLPAALVLAAFTVALFGLAPGLTGVSWAAVLTSLLLGQVGWALRLNQRLMDISPFTHVPRLPDDHVSATPLLWLAMVALALTAAGLAGFRRRDLAWRESGRGT